MSMSGSPAPLAGILAFLPSSLVPYAELGRIHKPTGFLNITFPYLYGAIYAATLYDRQAYILLSKLFCMVCSGFILRSAGCSWNDIIDRDLDRLVERCKSRPMARGALTVSQALAFTTALFAMWATILSSIAPGHWRYSIPLFAMVLVYPLMKRYTHFAQVFLGFTLSWGVIIGAMASGFDIADPMDDTGLYRVNQPRNGLVGLMASYVIWSVIHDTIYAQQDLRDDLKAKVKSLTVMFKDNLHLLLFSLSVAQIAVNGYVGYALSASFPYYALACLCNGFLCIYMSNSVKLYDTSDCATWFNRGCLLYGSVYFFALLSCYA